MEIEYNQIGCLNLTSNSIVKSNRLRIWFIIEKKMNKIEETNNNGVNTNSEDSEDGMDAAFENPVMKIIRGFSNVSHDAIRAIRFEHFFYQQLFDGNNLPYFPNNN